MMGGDSIVMMILNFELNKQFINRTDKEDPVADSQHYLFAHFDFVSEEWQNQAVTAIFTKDDISYYQLLDADGDCAIPHELIEKGEIFVSAFTGELITTNKSRVYIRESGYTEDGENTEPPTPNIYNQLTTQFNELRTDVYDRLANIDGGLFTDWGEE